MPIKPIHNSYVALIGAYERDNFGDILFLKVCEKLLAPWPIVPLSFQSNNMYLEGSVAVISASAWFDCCQEDFLPAALIVAGGEVLTCSVSDALSCDIGPTLSDAFNAMSQVNKTQLGQIVAWRSGELAYVPESTKFLNPNNQAIPIALNSVGGSGLKPGAAAFSTALEAIKQAAYVSVRDSVTHALFNGDEPERKSVDLNPDIVSTLPICCQAEVEAAYTDAISTSPWLTESYLLVQANDQYIREYGPEVIGEVIASTARALSLSVVFQPAGVASAHDSIEMLEELSMIVRDATNGKLHTYVQRDRGVWTQVAVIAHAACFVGTSLHGRIVASAYGRPRVGLKNSKVTIYASTWEEHDLQPFDTPIEDLPSAVSRAMAVAPSILLSHANKQAHLASTGFARLLEKLELTDHEVDVVDTKGRINFHTGLALLRECEVLRESMLALGIQLDQVRSQLAQEKSSREKVERKLFEILGAPSWLLAKPFRAFDRLFPGVKGIKNHNQ